MVQTGASLNQNSMGHTEIQELHHRSNLLSILTCNLGYNWTWYRVIYSRVDVVAYLQSVSTYLRISLFSLRRRLLYHFLLPMLRRSPPEIRTSVVACFARPFSYRLIRSYLLQTNLVSFPDLHPLKSGNETNSPILVECAIDPRLVPSTDNTHLNVYFYVTWLHSTGTKLWFSAVKLLSARLGRENGLKRHTVSSTTEVRTPW